LSGSYVYGGLDIGVEQINNSTGTVTYLHHDQAGSTRLLTGSTGTVTGKCSYTAYGTPTCEGATTTPLGYDTQYTSSDTGLIYMRARVYDPTTAQFLTVDPALSVTREPYGYTSDNPLNYTDRSGLGLEKSSKVARAAFRARGAQQREVRKKRSKAAFTQSDTRVELRAPTQKPERAVRSRRITTIPARGGRVLVTSGRALNRR
jgi:RHS repeat-associated protein